MKHRGNAAIPTLADLSPPGFVPDARALNTYPGQADWADAGSSHSCRECVAWGFTDDPVSYYAETGTPKPRECTAAKLPTPKPKVPYYARICKHFVANPEPPPAVRPERQRKPKEPAP